MTMLMSISLWTALPAALLIAGACALAIWAVRQPDQTTALITGLTEGQTVDDGCATIRPRDPKQQGPGEDHDYL